jgi:hypothetical protein
VQLLASVAFASDWLLASSAVHPGHSLSAVPLLQNPELLNQLKTKITIEPTHSLAVSTGIPPHVKQLNLMTSLLELCQTTLLRVNEQSAIVRESIFEAMELRAIKNGQVTCHQIVDILDVFEMVFEMMCGHRLNSFKLCPGLFVRVLAVLQQLVLAMGSTRTQAGSGMFPKPLPSQHL